MNPTTSPGPDREPDANFSQAELGKFGALANRCWGEPTRLRAIGSRGGERPRMDARAGMAHHGWFEAEQCL